MSLFVLREGYRVVTTPSGARVVHVRSGGTIDLSSEEVLLFARATAGGLDARDPRLRNIIRRFVTLGVLVSARSSGKPPQVVTRPPSAAAVVSGARPAAGGSAAASPSPTPANFSIGGPAAAAPAGGTRPPDNAPPARSSPRPKGDATVRLLRADLELKRRKPSGLLDVTDPRTGRTFPLYDFEVSLARMLDGQRLYSDVVEAGQRLGIPVDLVSLGQFVAQLDRYGFLAPPETRSPRDPEAESAWAPRQKWDEGLRALFQSGLRMHRQGRYAEAANYFEAMLQHDSQNPEALEMLEQSRQRMAGGRSPTAEVLLAPPDSGQVSLERLFFADDESSALPEMAPSAPAPSAEPQPRSRTGVRSAEKARPPDPPRIRWPIAAAIGGALAATAVAGWYFLSPREPPRAKVAVSKPVRSGPPIAAADGGSRPVLASAPGASPAAGAALQRAPESSAELAARNAAGASLDAGAVQPRAPQSGTQPLAQNAATSGERVTRTEVASPAHAGVAALGSAPAASSPPPTATAVQGGPRPEAGAVPSPGVAEEARREWISARIERRGRVTVAEVAAPASGVVSWTASPNQMVRRGEAIGTVRRRGTSRPRMLVAPGDGLFVPKVRSNSGVSAPQRVAAIVYPLAYLRASLANARPRPSWSCEVYQEDSSARADCKIVTVVRRRSRSLVTATTEALWFDTAPGARMRVSPPR